MAQFKYRLASLPSARHDGSGLIDHDIWAIYSEDGGVTWSTFPGGMHKTISVPAEDISTALASGTNAEKTDAYKQLLVDNRNTQPASSLDDFSLSGLQARYQMDVIESQAVADVQVFLGDIGKPPPVDFAL